MEDTGFHVPADKLDRLPAAYRPDPGRERSCSPTTPARACGGRPPTFPSAGGGLVSTADDRLAFWTMMLDQGWHGGERILSGPSVALMTTDQPTGEHKSENAVFFGARAAGDRGSTSSRGETTSRPSPGDSAGMAGRASRSTPIRPKS
jgi:CubicO group peptidase (beta-lactamase class C family)